MKSLQWAWLLRVLLLNNGKCSSFCSNMEFHKDNILITPFVLYRGTEYIPNLILIYILTL